jgi:hypothetical protein
MMDSSSSRVCQHSGLDNGAGASSLAAALWEGAASFSFNGWQRSPSLEV